ncbi:MAG: hypothetical protein ACO395_07695 [Pontimonas sp.]
MSLFTLLRRSKNALPEVEAVAPNWTRDDAAAFRNFLASAPGDKFQKIVSRAYFDACAAAAEDPDPHKCGQAHGRKVFWQMLTALAEVGDQDAP